MSQLQLAQRVALSDLTNTSCPLSQDGRPPKRAVSTQCNNSNKRARVDIILEKERVTAIQDTSTSRELDKAEPHNCTIYNALHSARMRRSRGFQPTSSESPVLTSFVSSNKMDVHKLHCCDDPIEPGLPFACAFTTDAKRGGAPILAVATQEGSVELLTFQRREEWDSEAHRTTVQVHGNAILDVKWGVDDQYLATSSGDSTTRITSVSTQQCLAVLAHHTSSVKSSEWDPNHTGLLSTAGRDGSICVWDLRTMDHGRMTEPSTHAPVIIIPHAHCDKSRGKTAKSRSTSKSVTSVLYLPHCPQQLVSSGSFDGMLRQWDLRYPLRGQTRNAVMVSESYSDPTLATSLRGRGITSLALGRNHSSGYIWAMATDSCIHTYPLPIAAPFNSSPNKRLKHPGMFVNSFYVKLAVSPCGSWLTGGSSGGGVYLWDVASRSSKQLKAVELKAGRREIGAVDWAKDFFAACCDDGTVRLWRPDHDISIMCKTNPEEEGERWVWATDGHEQSIQRNSNAYF